MSERYENMRNLRDHLEKLYRLCGIPEQRIDVKMSSKVIVFLESLFNDQSLNNFLYELDDQAERAIAALEERQPDMWDIKEKERLLKETQIQLEDIKYELRISRQKLMEVKEQRDQFKTELENARSMMHKKEKVLKSINDSDINEKVMDQANVGWIQNIITMRDNLLMRRDWIAENEPENINARKLVESQLRETGALLTKAGVEILEDDGLFDSSRHTVIDTKFVDDPLLHNQIAEVFRPGYTYKDNVLRGQEVILYVCRTQEIF